MDFREDKEKETRKAAPTQPKCLRVGFAQGKLRITSRHYSCYCIESGWSEILGADVLSVRRAP